MQLTSGRHATQLLGSAWNTCSPIASTTELAGSCHDVFQREWTVSFNLRNLSGELDKN